MHRFEIGWSLIFPKCMRSTFIRLLFPVFKAIFPRDGGLEAPSCVVGFQFSHELLYERFMEITSKVEVSLVVPFKRFAFKFLSSIFLSASIAWILVEATSRCVTLSVRYQTLRRQFSPRGWNLLQSENVRFFSDNNGFILVSEENKGDTGRFFGEVETRVMESMIHQNIFKKLVIYDLQGLCKNITEIQNPEDANASPSMMTVSLMSCWINNF